METFNVYCDESCHLEHDTRKVMVLGGIWCPVEKTYEINSRLREIKAKHKVSPQFEVKWTKVSPAKVDLYIDFIDYFFDDDDLHFRGLVIPDKNQLDHKAFNQTHDEWYYKMYFEMLKVIITDKDRYRIYLDIKDTWGSRKVENLRDVLCNNMFDYSKHVIERIQLVRSHEVEILQLVDLMIGALAYVNENLFVSKAKKQLVQRIQKRSNYSLVKTTLPRESKVNILIWKPSQRIF